MKIYLIGGPPKCGKTTTSKLLSKKTGIPYVSTDMIESILQYYLPVEAFPKKILKKSNSKSNDDFYTNNSANQIKESYISQSQTSNKAIRSIVETTIIEKNDIIIEGYHITPKLVNELLEEFGHEKIKSIFLVKTDLEKFLEDIHKSTTPNDWILQKTKEKSTFTKIANMIISYSDYFVKEAKKYNLEYLNLSENFESKIKDYISEVNSK